jgi:hypothetical protein
VSHDFEEFERQMDGVDDPSPFLETAGPNHAAEVCLALNDITNMVVVDIVRTINEGKPAIIAYLNRSNGAAVTSALLHPRKLAIVITLAADDVPFVTAVPIGEAPDDMQEFGESKVGEPFDPDKDDGWHE